MSVLKLYELTDSYKQIADMIDESAPDEALQMALKQIGGAIQEKAANIAKLVKSIEFETKAIKEEEERLAKMRLSREKSVVWLKDYLKAGLNAANIKKIEKTIPTGYTVALQKNGRGTLTILDEKKVPAKYITIIPPVPEQRVPNKELIEKDIKAGKTFTWADYEVGEHIRIR